MKQKTNVKKVNKKQKQSLMFWRVELFRFSPKRGIYKAKARISKVGLFAAVVALIVLSVSLFFAQPLQKAFALYPDLSGIGQDAMEVHFIDVGQGDAIAVRFPNNQTMLVDAGPKSAEEELLYYLDHIFFANDTTPKFDYIVLTHSDADHSGNMQAVLNTYEVYHFFRPDIYALGVDEDYESSDTVVETQTYINLITTVLQKQELGMQVWQFYGGLEISGENQAIEFYSPNVPNYSDLNDYSPIMIVQGYDMRVMLTGDATVDVEREVINNYDEADLDVDILKLGHHGSDTSTSYEFLEVVKPEYGVISVSENNSYGHPSEEVLQIVSDYSQTEQSELQNNLLATSELGNIIFYANQQGDLQTLNIENSFAFLYMDWWVFAVSAMGAVCILFATRGVRFKAKLTSI